MKAAYYEGDRTITVGACVPARPQAGEVQLRGLALRHLRHRPAHLPWRHGHAGDHAADHGPRDVGRGHRRLGQGVEGFRRGRPGDGHAPRPLRRLPGLPGRTQPHLPESQVPRHRHARRLSRLWTVPAHTLHRLPDNLSLDHGALIEPLAVACHDVRLGGVQAGEYVVVLGGGPIGMLVALVAQQAGAKVLVSEINPYRVATGPGTRPGGGQPAGDRSGRLR